MTQKIPSSSLSNQSTITSAGTSSSPATLSGYWQLNQTLTGNINGNANTATSLAATHTIAGQSFNGTQDVNFTTDSVGEGTTNKYYLTSRAQADAKSVIGLDSAGAASGGGNLSYSSSTGHFQFSPANLAPYAPLLNPSFTQSITLGDGYDVIWITNGSGTTGNATNRIQANTTAGVTVVTDSQFRVYNNGAIAVTVDVNKNMTIGGSYYGDGSHLTGISQPTNLNQLTNGPGYITSYPSNTLHQVASYTTGYLGDYLSGSGGGPIQTGSFVSSAGGGGCCGLTFWQWFTTYEFDQSYFPGYTANDIDHVSVHWSGYNVTWLSYAGGNFTVKNVDTVIYHPFNTGSGPSSGYDKIRVQVQILSPYRYVNNRGSPQTWPYALEFRFFARG